MSSLHVDANHRIPDYELDMRASKSSGPGGQSVNTTDSAVELRWYPEASRAFTPDEKRRISKKLSNRITKDGCLIVRASEHKSQHRNREEARQRLKEWLVDALRVSKRRRRTRPSRASKRRRVENKRHRGEVKRLRQNPQPPA
ncbi:alternative ribosome rescue aminoacyl-tRNA hydrolase ArfB [Salsipaludibacter albus]|uniref:alternative ribosome rescue aminoacyl-tRNA hydrolase ArfB n=1 Tax=Salsipaludibacter albus TaxID=2849650 RepID=UPI001EE4E3A6|nr:alternative ribosome rescue aminoacyl-tRNA hydrolase ArfB [Salsipaludibacter albus]MBY5163791.1 aminoacyl-tRNA hydrolase [Salsipaludibacter albus]